MATDCLRHQPRLLSPSLSLPLHHSFQTILSPLCTEVSNSIYVYVDFSSRPPSSNSASMSSASLYTISPPFRRLDRHHCCPLPGHKESHRIEWDGMGHGSGSEAQSERGARPTIKLWKKG